MLSFPSSGSLSPGSQLAADAAGLDSVGDEWHGSNGSHPPKAPPAMRMHAPGCFIGGDPSRQASCFLAAHRIHLVTPAGVIWR